MSATRLSARRTCCQGPHREIMVVYVLLSQSRRRSLSSGNALTQSNNCHALHGADPCWSQNHLPCLAGE